MWYQAPSPNKNSAFFPLLSDADLACWGWGSRGHASLQNTHVQQQRRSRCAQVTLTLTDGAVSGTVMVVRSQHRTHLWVFFFPLTLQPWWSALGWKHARRLAGHLCRVWRWLWGWGTNCSHWEMYCHVQLPRYVTGVFQPTPWSSASLKSAVPVTRACSQGYCYLQAVTKKKISFLSTRPLKIAAFYFNVMDEMLFNDQINYGCTYCL